jgi:hypothetical protein
VPKDGEVIIDEAKLKEIVAQRDAALLQNSELKTHLKYMCMLAERLGKPSTPTVHREEALALLDGTLKEARELLTEKPKTEGD